MPLKIICALFACFIFLCAHAEAATTFPYINTTLKLPGSDDPYPGLGSNYSSLGVGIRTVLWNPAGLAKINATEAYLGATSAPAAIVSESGYKMKDVTFEVSGTAGTSTSNYSTSILYTNSLTATTQETRDFVAKSIYTPSSSGTDFKQAVRIADWLAVGITSRGNLDAGFAMSGTFPLQYYASTNLTGVSNFMSSGISIGSDDKLTYTYKPSGGTSYTYTSEAAVWSGFTKQNQRIPFSILTDLRNNMNIQQNLTFSSAAKWGGFLFGANLTPVSASINVDNTAKAIVNEGTADQYSYTPTFNPNNEDEVLQWLTNPSSYGTEAGYKKKYLRVTAGQSVGEAKYTGFYEASASRMDFGVMYDFKDTATLGLVLENANAAALNFKGTGRVAYVNTRISTTEGIGNLIDPSTNLGWSPFSDNFSAVGGTEGIGMLPEMNFALPQRTRIGFTLRKPIIITLDYELQNNSIAYRYQDSTGGYSNAVFSNVAVVRGGLESQLFFFPVIVRSSAAFLLKPTASGLDAASQSSFDSAFYLFKRLSLLSTDLGANFDFFGYDASVGFGLNMMPVLSILQLDTLNAGLSKILYYNISAKKDNWSVTFQNYLDPIAALQAYSNAPASQRAQSGYTKYLDYIRWVSTLNIGFSF